MTFQDILPAYQTWGFSHAISQFRAELAHRRQRRKAYNNTFCELSAMSDRELADIGIARGDIAYIATEVEKMV